MDKRLNIRYKKVLILTDNEFLYLRIREYLDKKKKYYIFDRLDFRYSYNNEIFLNKYKGKKSFKAINVKTACDLIIRNYDLVFSLHCKQFFPKELVNSTTCINVHPGYNPYNRGWYPQVFSIINGMPVGATIHIMDEQLDHGQIIDQQQVAVEEWDTSLSLYNKILDLELRLFDKNIDRILKGEHTTYTPEPEGNVNLKKDFNVLREIKLERVGTFGNFIDYLRALTHGDYKNCYFVGKDGEKVYVKIILEKDRS